MLIMMKVKFKHSHNRLRSPLPALPASPPTLINSITVLQLTSELLIDCFLFTKQTKHRHLVPVHIRLPSILIKGGPPCSDWGFNEFNTCSGQSWLSRPPQAIINSTITPNMTFTKTSHKFGQWADSRANTVYGLGFSSESHLAKVRTSQESDVDLRVHTLSQSWSCCAVHAVVLLAPVIFSLQRNLLSSRRRRG